MGRRSERAFGIWALTEDLYTKIDDQYRSEDVSPDVIEKVTAFVTRTSPAGTDLLLIQHPFAGNQIPAGTVDPGETPEIAVLRELREETGLRDVSLPRFLGVQDDPPLPGHLFVSRPTTVYARPDPLSFDWATLPRAAMVRTERSAGGYTQVTYAEPDRLPDPSYMTYQITGWAPNSALTRSRTRYFYQLTCHQLTGEIWEVEIDHHRFRLFWAPLAALPVIIPPQDGWLVYLARTSR